MSSIWASAKISWLPRCAAAHLMSASRGPGKAGPTERRVAISGESRCCAPTRPNGSLVQ
jgi:hypothetical protein